jgi:hypothetical protein
MKAHKQGGKAGRARSIRSETLGNYRAEEAVFEKLKDINTMVSYLPPIAPRSRAVYEASDAALHLCLTLLTVSSIPLFWELVREIST